MKDKTIDLTRSERNEHLWNALAKPPHVLRGDGRERKTFRPGTAMRLAVVLCALAPTQPILADPFPAQTSVERQAEICASDVVLHPHPLSADERLPNMAADQMSEEQRRAVASLSAGPRGCLFGPFVVLLRSPDLLERVQKLGEYLRFHSEIPLRSRELAILVAGYDWRQPYVWYVHEPIARAAGVSSETVAALARGDRPEFLSPDDQAVYDFTIELFRNRAVSERNYDAVRTRFGDKGVVDLTALNGYFALLAMELTVARTPVPPGYPIQFSPAMETKGE